MAPITRTAAQTMVDLIYDDYAKANNEPPRGYLGMSGFATDCDRALWYGFRWAVDKEKFSGRLLRLFQTGHREEARMIEDLKRIGIEIEERDPATGEQWALRDSTGHMRGHMDGVAVDIPGVGRAVLEFKTHNETSFKSLVTGGVKASKPGHLRQLMLYMHFSGIPKGFYLAHSKNSDELYGEIIDYDPAVGQALERRGQRVVQAQNPPARLFEDPTSKAAYVCKMCNAFSVCHKGQFAKRNCRTCLHSTPIAEGEFHCAKFDEKPSREFQAEGCVAHRYIPSLVPGKLKSATNEFKITYELTSGGTFIDGPHN